jgi:hypothetical protein
MTSSSQRSNEPDRTQRSTPAIAAVNSAQRSGGSILWTKGGSLGAQAKSSASRCLTPSASATAAPSVVVPEPDAPVMWMRRGLS